MQNISYINTLRKEINDIKFENNQLVDLNR